MKNLNDLTVVIVTYKTPEKIIFDCLESINLNTLSELYEKPVSQHIEFLFFERKCSNSLKLFIILNL